MDKENAQGHTGPDTQGLTGQGAPMAQLPLVTEAEAVTPPPQMGTPTTVYPLGMGPGTASTGSFPSLGSLLRMDDAQPQRLASIC